MRGFCHLLGTIEPMVANGAVEPLVAADLDLVNMCGNAEWPCIRQANRTQFLEDSAWTEWQHQSESVTFLTTSAAFAANLEEAEQGDVLGTIQIALVLGQARRVSISSSPLSSRPRASVMNGSLTDKCL